MFTKCILTKFYYLDPDKSTMINAENVRLI